MECGGTNCSWLTGQIVDVVEKSQSVFGFSDSLLAPGTQRIENE